MNDGVTIRFDDHSAELLRQLGDKARVALEAVGVQAEANAKLNITDAARMGLDLTQYGEQNNSRVDTGRLRNSISHTYIDEPNNPVVYVGTNVEYAPYHEFGTGIYASRPGGRQSPWVYVDRKGVGHMTRGLYPTHFLRNAIESHMDEYRDVIAKVFRQLNG